MTSRGKTSPASTDGSFAPGSTGSSTAATVQRGYGADDRPGPKEGSRTPWGPAQHVHERPSGLIEAGTAGHGGIWVPPHMRSQIPKEFRDTSAAAGWYEEDAAAAAAAVPMYFCEGETDEDRARLKSEWPDEYEAWSGETVTAEESWVRAIQNKKQQERDERAKGGWRLDSVDSEKFEVDGATWRKVNASEGGETRTFLVPEDRDGMYPNRMMDRTYRLPDSRIDVTGIAEYPRETPGPVTPDTSGLTERQNEAVKKWGAQRVRRADGSVVRQETIGVTGVSAEASGTRIKYWCATEDGYALDAPAAVAKAYLNAGAEDRTQHARWSAVRSRADEAAADFDLERTKKLRAKAAALKVEVDAVDDAWSERTSEWRDSQRETFRQMISDAQI